MTLFPAAPRPTADLPDVSDGVRILARMGYAAKGIVYLVVGGLAVKAARTPVEDPSSSSGALRSILSQPYGRAMLAVIAIGLAGYVLWRLVQTFADPERKGTDLKGIATRAGYAISALLHAALTLEAVRLLRGTAGSDGGGQQADHWTGMAMRQPFGRWVVGAVGVAIIAYGLFELYRAARSRLDQRLNLAELGEGARTALVRLGRLGYAARGVVFGIIGWFLVQAALQYDAREATDLGGALETLRAREHGPWMLGAVGVGLAAYGIWQLTSARFRRIHP